MKCAIYCRLSSLEKEEGESLSRQEKKCSELARSRDWEIVEVYRDEDQSGATLKRPAMDRLRQDAQANKFQLVLTWKQDRLSRSLLDTVRLVLEEWLPHGIEYRSVENPELDTSSSVGKIMFQILAMFAEFERERIRERMLEGKISQVRKNKFPGIRLPFGYRVDDNKNIIIHPDEAQVIRTWYKWIVEEGLSLEKIAIRSNEIGFRTKRGGQWWASNIRSMLLNDSVYGKLNITYQPVMKGGTTFKESLDIEPILTAEHKDILLQAFERNLVKSKRNTRNFYMLRGLLKCRRCNRAMLGYNHEKKRMDGSTYFYFNYYCSGGKKHHLHGGTGCKIPSVLGHEVEDFIWNEVVKTVKSPAILFDAIDANQRSAAASDFDKTINNLRKQLEQKESALLRNFELYEGGMLEKEIVTARIKKLQAEKKNLESAVDEIQKKRLEQDRLAMNSRNLRKQLEELSKNLDRFDDSEKAQFLNLVLDKAEIDCLQKIAKKEGTFRVWLYFNSVFLEKLSQKNGELPNKNNGLLQHGCNLQGKGLPAPRFS